MKNLSHRLGFLIPALTLPGLLSLSCKSGNDTAIVIHVVSDNSLGLNAVDTTARPVSRGPDTGQDMATKTAHFADPSNVTWTLSPSGSDKMFAVEIEARGIQNGRADPVVAQRAVVAFQSGRHIEITMSLERACVTVSCPSPLTCQHGVCVDPGMGMTVVDGGNVDGTMDTSLEDRPPNDDRVADAGDGRRDTPLVDGALPGLLGVGCQADVECGSSHCVDGVCCNETCTSSCQQCNSLAMPGYCIAVPAGQPAPGKRAPCTKDDVSTCKQTGLCDGKGSCQLYADGEICQMANCNAIANTITGSRCDGVGSCKTELPQSCAPFRCKTGDTQCGRSCTANADCDGQPCVTSSCGKLKVGAACSADTDCEFGFCVDKVCCNVRCSGQCQACDLSTSVGTCSSVRSGQPVGGRTLCTGSGTCGGSCNGQADCGFPATTVSCRVASCDGSARTATASCNGAGACPALSTSVCPNHLRCQTGTALCLAQCATTADCVPGFFCSGTTCTATKTNGMACLSGNECTSTVCVDNVCCSATCTGTCLTCATGTCLAVTNGDDNTCTGALTCNSIGACVKKQGQPCVSDVDCTTGQCADGVCCDRDCSGACEACSGTGVAVPGTCAFVAGTPRIGHPGCMGTGTCAATCRGQIAACVFPGPELNCRPAMCMSSGATLAAACDGAGNCPALATRTCSPFTCAGSGCLTTCAANSQCVAGVACIGTGCAACPAGQGICPNVNGCVNLSMDGNNCGSCGHSCLGGLCANSTCLPVRLATIPGGINGLAVNSTTVFTFLGTSDSSAFSVFGIAKSAQNLTPTPLLTVTSGPMTSGAVASGYMGASEGLFIWEAFTGSQAGKFSAVYSCDPRSCPGTLHTWFNVVNNGIACDPVAQKCFAQANGSNEVRVAALATAPMTAPQSFSPPLVVATGGGLTTTDGFVYAAGAADIQLPLPVLDRVPEDSSAVKTRLANFSSAATVNSLFGPVIATSRQVFFVGQTSDGINSPTVGIMSVTLPLGMGDHAPSFLLGTTMPDFQFSTYWADDDAIFFVSSAQQFVTCPAAGCSGPATPLADASTANRVLVGDSQAIYWIVALARDSNGSATSAAVMKVAR